MKSFISSSIRLSMLCISLALCLAEGDVMAEVVTVVSSKSSVTMLNKNQVADLFLGKTNRFPDGSKAVPVDQAEGSITRDEFYTALVSKSAAQMKAHWSKIIFTGRGQPPKEILNSIEVKNFVAENPNAIGYIEQTLLDSRVRVVLQNDSAQP